MSCRSRFSTPKKTRHPYWADAGFRHRLSSSPDSRIIDFTQPSQISPMTDLSSCMISPRSQWRYRSGLTPDSLLDPKTCYRCKGHLNRFIHFSHNKISLENYFVNHVFQKFLLHNQNCCVRMKQRKLNINLTVTV